MVPSEMTNDDILGDEVPLDKMESMRTFCNDVVKVQFYRATWKADGTRYMMLITWDGCYLIDRKFKFRRVHLRFPCDPKKGAAGETHNYTLLDGEMVIVTDPVKHTQERRYLVYDMIAINEGSLVDHPFSCRWKILQNEVINHRNKERGTLCKIKNLYYRYDLELFRVRRKDFFLLSYAPKLLKEFIPRLSHALDGLIFQPRDDPYKALTHKRLLKWKYPEMNSVDFLLEVGNSNRPMLYLNECGERKLIDGTLRDPSVDKFSLSGKIIECS
ncbi:mRNA-capping enzyme-like protein isoform X2 [Tanacetum coccineum]